MHANLLTEPRRPKVKDVKARPSESTKSGPAPKTSLGKEGARATSHPQGLGEVTDTLGITAKAPPPTESFTCVQ